MTTVCCYIINFHAPFSHYHLGQGSAEGRLVFGQAIQVRAKHTQDRTSLVIGDAIKHALHFLSSIHACISHLVSELAVE